MRAELVLASDLTPEWIAQWQELATRAVEPNPFFEPEFVLPAVRHLVTSGGEPFLATVSTGDRLRVIFPVQRGYRVRGIPAPHLSVWRHLYCFLGTPLVDGEEMDEAIDEVTDLLQSAGGRWRLLVLEWLGDHGPVASSVERALIRSGRAPIRFPSVARAISVRPDPLAPGHATSSRHRRLKRTRRALERHAGADVEVVDRSADGAAVERFLSLEAAGWKGRGSSAIASTPRHADFFREMCAGFTRMGRLRFLALEAGDHTIAMIVCIQAGDAIFYFKAAYDEAYGRFSPGGLLEMEAPGRLFADGGVRWIDSCADPRNELANRLMDQRRTVSTFIVPPKGRLPRAMALGMLNAFRRMRGRGAQA